MAASMTTPELKQFWEQTCQKGERATVPDLLCVFINFGKLQHLFHAHTRRCTQVFGNWLSVSCSVMPSQIEVYALCNYIGAASYFLSRGFQTWTPLTPPQFPCIHTKFAARCVKGGQPAAARGQRQHWQRAWKPGSSFPERELNNWKN